MSFLEKFIEMSILYDFYGELLSEKQRIVVDCYYNDNFSLGEIAEKVNISRQGVYDSLKRAEELLREYDSKLKLMEKYKVNKELLKKAIENLKHYDGNKPDILDEVKEDLEQLLKQL